MFTLICELFTQHREALNDNSSTVTFGVRKCVCAHDIPVDADGSLQHQTLY